MDLRAQVRRHPRPRFQAAAPTCGCYRATACRSTCPLSPTPSRACRSRADSRRRSDLGRAEIGYHVFDMLWLDGRDVTSLPLDERRALLDELPLRAPLRACGARSSAAVGTRLQRRVGRRHRQAARLAVRASPLPALAQDEMRGDAGAGRRRLHRSAGRARRPRRAARRLLRRRRLRFRRQSRHRVRHEAAAGACARGSTRSRSRSRRSRRRSACRACARTGCVPRSSCRWPSSSGRCTASCGTPVCSAFARTSTRARSVRRRRDHASRRKFCFRATASPRASSRRTTKRSRR